MCFFSPCPFAQRSGVLQNALNTTAKYADLEWSTERPCFGSAAELASVTTHTRAKFLLPPAAAVEASGPIAEAW